MERATKVSNNKILKGFSTYTISSICSFLWPLPFCIWPLMRFKLLACALECVCACLFFGEGECCASAGSNKIQCKMITIVRLIVTWFQCWMLSHIFQICSTGKNKVPTRFFFQLHHYLNIFIDLWYVYFFVVQFCFFFLLFCSLNSIQNPNECVDFLTIL